MKVNRDQLKIEKKLGEIVPFDRHVPGENYIIAYIDILPVKIKTNDEKMTQEEFDKLCE